MMQPQVEASVYLAPPEMMKASGPYQLANAPGASFYVPHRLIPIGMTGGFHKPSRALVFRFDYVDKIKPIKDDAGTEVLPVLRADQGGMAVGIAFAEDKSRVSVVRVEPFDLSEASTTVVADLLREAIAAHREFEPQVSEHGKLAVRATLWVLAARLHQIVAELREKMERRA